MKGVIIPINDIGQGRIAAVKSMIDTIGVVVEMKVKPGIGSVLRFVDEADAAAKLPRNARGDLIVPFAEGDGYVVDELPPREMGGSWFRLK